MLLVLFGVIFTLNKHTPMFFPPKTVTSNGLARNITSLTRDVYYYRGPFVFFRVSLLLGWKRRFFLFVRPTTLESEVGNYVVW